MGKHYRKVCQESLPFSLKPSIPELPRRLQSAYIQLKTGIGYIGAYQALMSQNTGRCTRCTANKKQTTAHLVLHCRAYQRERKQMKEALEGLPLSLQTLFCTGKGKAALAGFLRDTEICTARWSQGAD